MRRLAESLDASKASDAISGEVLGWVLARRIASLQDDPSHDAVLRPHRHRPRDEPAERSTSDGGTSPTRRATRVVIDWRAPMSTAFYRASRTEPMGVGAAAPVRRRPRAPDRLRGRAPPASRPSTTGRSQILADEIERPRVGPDARHRRDHPARAGRDRPRRRRRPDDLRAGGARAPARPRSACTARPGCSTRSATGWPAPASSSSAPTAPSSTTSVPCCPPLGEVRVGHTTIEELARARAGPRRRHHRHRRPQGRRPARRGAPPCRVVAACSAPTEALVVPRGVRKWRVPAYEVHEILDELAARGRALRRRARRCCRSGSRTHVLLQMERAGRLPGRPRAGPGGAQSAVVKKYAATAVAGARRQGRCCSRCSSDPDALAAPPTDVLDRRGAADPAVGQPRSHQGHGPLVARRHGAARRARRPHRAHAEPRSRRARRGAGPVAHAAARRRPALLDRVGDGARRHRPGHDPVGDRLVGVVAAPPRQARQPRRGPGPRLPRAGQRSSSTPRSCCRTWRPGWARRCRCATTRAGSTWSRVGARDLLTRTAAVVARRAAPSPARSA